MPALPAPQPLLLPVPPSSWRVLTSVRLAWVLCAALALVPVGFMLQQAAGAAHDVAYWDELDSALALVLRLKAGMTPAQFFHDLFAVTNEHRTVTSRLLFAASYGLTGTVNFAFVSLVGNGSLLAMCGLLIWSAGTAVRRMQLGLLLAFLLFQLEHWENFFWSGSLIDHFQIVLLAAGTIIALARGTWPALLGGVLLALLATFTLAHGLLLWPVGAAMLWGAGRRRHLGLWCGGGMLAAAGYLAGFAANTAHEFAETSWGGSLVIAHYWLTLLGVVPALGPNAAAPWLGGLLLLALLAAAWRGAARGEPVAFPLACYAVLALALIALGRAGLGGGVVHSRYYVLGALAWALVAFIWLERTSLPRRPLLLLAVVVPVLAGFNLAANRAFAADAASWIECRDRAVVSFEELGIDGLGPFSLHPRPEHSTAMLNAAEDRGVYRIAPVCRPRLFPKAQSSSRIVYHVDGFNVGRRSLYVTGWAAIPAQVSRRGQLHLVLRGGGKTHVFSTVAITRPDVSDAHNEPRWRQSGFRFARRRDRLPVGEFQVGIFVARGRRSEYIMTDHRVNLTDESRVLTSAAP